MTKEPAIYIYDFDEEKLFFGKTDYLDFCCDSNIDPDYNETTDLVQKSDYDSLKKENEELTTKLEKAYEEIREYDLQEQE